MDELNEICENCGLTFGSHHIQNYYCELYKMYITRNCCPGHGGRMGWDEGPGTVFSSSGKYKKEVEYKMYMKQFDTRWITFPIACLLAIVVGDISWWVILSIIVGCFPVFLTLKRRK